jgi:hypothetical protein
MRSLMGVVLLATLLISLNAFSQKRKCSSYENYVQQLKANPLFAQSQSELQTFTRKFIQNGGSRSIALTERGSVVYTIPVVIHIVHKLSIQNISYGQAKSQIDVLNQDFQLKNEDASLVPSVFSGDVTDCKIKFCLAKTDPYGNPTSGVVRRKTTVDVFSDNDDVKFTSKGGDDAWPSDKYLNIWVCNLGNGLLGYGQFPGGAAKTDGVVILFSAFGTKGAVIPPFNKGRTATHEIGHWLNLFHIWGDDNGACDGTDLVDDTPNQGAENYGCPTFPHKSCKNGPNGDMFMNYMDYTNDACMFMFTNGQRDRMYATLKTLRKSLTLSNVCSKPDAPACANPTGLKTSSITTTSAKITWRKSPSAKSYTLKYKKASAKSYTIISGLKDTFYVLKELASNTIYQYQLRANCSSTNHSNYTYPMVFTTKEIVLPCVDKYENNNSLSAAKTIPLNTDITGIISSETDVDFYSFSITSAAPDIKITLRNLPADYDMTLYDPSGNSIAFAQNTGTENEMILYNLTKMGKYKLRVYGYNSFNPNKCYLLNIMAADIPFIKKDKDVSTATENDIILYPQPAQDYVLLQFNEKDNGKIKISVFDQTGRTVISEDAITGTTYRFNTSSLTNGLYYIRITTENGAISKKMIIQR